MRQFRFMLRLSLYLLFAVVSICAVPGYAGTCSNPTRNEGDIIYNADYHTYQFCNGTSSIGFGGGMNCTTTVTGYSPTTPSGTGYFVLTNTTYNGNLGGFVGADALCLTELTTNTNWRGYATANANGQLVASK